MSDEQWFCWDDAEWTALVERLKLTACPHCRTVGTLIRHGVLTGFDDSSPRRTVRTRRIFCSDEISYSETSVSTRRLGMAGLPTSSLPGMPQGPAGYFYHGVSHLWFNSGGIRPTNANA